MHTKCKTSCDLNVSYAHRRIDRIAFTAPTACRKIRTRVSHYRARASLLRFRARHLPRPRRRRRNSSRTRRTLVGTSVTTTRITTSPSRLRRRRARRARVAHHAHPLFAIKTFRIDRTPPRERTYASYAASRSSRGLARTRPRSIERRGSRSRAAPSSASRISRAALVRARSPCAIAVDGRRRRVALCRTTRAAWETARRDGGTRNTRKFVVGIAARSNAPTDRKDAARRHTTTLSGRRTNEDARDVRTRAIEARRSRIRVGFARRATHDRAVDARRDAKAFPPKGQILFRGHRARDSLASRGVASVRWRLKPR